MEIWIKQGDVRFQIPINPPEVFASMDMGVTTVKIPTFGEVTLVGRRGCRTISWESFWPAREYAFAMCAPYFKPGDFRSFMNGNKYKPFELTLTGTSIKSVPFLMRSFVYDKFDADGDMKYTLDFIEYRKPEFAEKNTSSNTSTPGAAESVGVGNGVVVKEPATTRPKKETPKTYTVRSGDNLMSIAKSLTGSSSNSKAIYNANKSVIEKAAQQHGYTSSSNNGIAGWWIFPGTKLVIPQ